MSNTKVIEICEVAVLNINEKDMKELSLSSVADAIKNWKESDKKNTLTGLSETAGVSRQYISDIMNGNKKDPSLEVVSKILKGIGVKTGIYKEI